MAMSDDSLWLISWACNRMGFILKYPKSTKGRHTSLHLKPLYTSSFPKKYNSLVIACIKISFKKLQFYAEFSHSSYIYEQNGCL